MKILEAHMKSNHGFKISQSRLAFKQLASDPGNFSIKAPKSANSSFLKAAIIEENA